MHCPKDGADLQTTIRDGVEIEVCPSCRGVWLDRGELEKIISRSLGGPEKPEGYNRERDRDSSYIGELFDF